MTTESLLLLIIIVLIAGVWPSWPYSKAWGYAPTRALTMVLVIFLLWDLSEGRPLFRGSGQDIQTTVQDAGGDLKSAGRDVADSIRHIAQ